MGLFLPAFDIRASPIIEPKPGIPPSPGHVAELIRRFRNSISRRFFTSTSNSKQQAQTIADRTGAVAVVAAANAAAPRAPIRTIDLVSRLVHGIAAAFKGK